MSVWRWALRVLTWLATFVAVFFAAGFVFVDPKADERWELEESTSRLLEEYLAKSRVAENLDAVRAQLRAADQRLAQAVRTLPDTFDREFAYLHDAARRRGARVEQTKLIAEQPREFYSRLPMHIKVSGRFHDLGAFAADLDRAPGCLVLQDLRLYRASTPGQVTMEAWVLAHRYLTDAEVAARRKAAQAGTR